jgi:hypothetical protein
MSLTAIRDAAASFHQWTWLVESIHYGMQCAGSRPINKVG